MFYHISVLTHFIILFISYPGECMFIEKILKENVVSKDFVEMYIPTLNAINEECRNDSIIYATDLKKYKLWASESKYYYHNLLIIN